MYLTKTLNLSILENNVFDYRTVLPTLLNSYSRKYFLSCDRKFRITLDDKQLFYNLYEQKRPKDSTTDNESVLVELEYSQDEEPKSKEYFLDYYDFLD